MKVIVYHGGYGCETGCCGHWVELVTDEEHAEAMKSGEKDPFEWGAERPEQSRFTFDHFSGGDEEAAKAFAREVIEDEMGKEHCADLDWDNCKIVSTDDCPM